MEEEGGQRRRGEEKDQGEQRTGSGELKAGKPKTGEGRGAETRPTTYLNQLSLIKEKNCSISWVMHRYV